MSRWLWGNPSEKEEARKVLLAEQGGRCAVCDNPLTRQLGGVLGCVDHCHETGLIRGVLCVSCNSGLGKFHDSIDKLLGALAYLQRAQAVEENLDGDMALRVMRWRMNRGYDPEDEVLTK